MQALLLVLLGVLYSGAVQFLFVYWPEARFVVGAAIGGCLVWAILRRRHWLSDVSPVLTYFAWVSAYLAWGAFTFPDPSAILADAVGIWVRNALVLLATASALTSRSSLSGLAALVQVAAVANLWVCVCQHFDPDLMEEMAHTLNPETDAFNVVRPAGLWINPNEAAFAFLFASLLAFWSPRPLAWVGRCATVAGIAMTASRSGLYLLVLNALIWVAFHRHMRSTGVRRLSKVGVAVGSVLAAALVVAYGLDLPQTRSTESWSVDRLLDFSGTEVLNAEELSRGEVALRALDRIGDSPWYGSGVLSFQGYGKQYFTGDSFLLSQGTHNIYLAVWGEVGFFGLVAYLLVLLLGLRRYWLAPLSRQERVVVGCMWLDYLVIGFVWHNQVSNISGMLYAGLLFSLPQVLCRSRPVLQADVPALEGGESGELREPACQGSAFGR